MNSSLKQTATVNARHSEVISSLLYTTDTSLNRTPRVGPCHSLVLLFDCLQDKHLPKTDTLCWSLPFISPKFDNQKHGHLAKMDP